MNTRQDSSADYRSLPRPEVLDPGPEADAFRSLISDLPALHLPYGGDSPEQSPGGKSADTSTSSTEDTDSPDSPEAHSSPDSTPSSPTSGLPGNTDNMAPRIRPTVVRRETDIGDILTLGQKNDLTQLITSITDTMRDQINRNLDPVTTASLASGRLPKADAWRMMPSSFDAKAPQPNQKENLKQPKENKYTMNLDKDFEMVEAMADRVGFGASLSIDQAETLAPSLENLKKDVLTAFRRWQGLVIKRSGEMTVSKDSAVLKTLGSSSTANRTQQRPGGVKPSAKPAGQALRATRDRAKTQDRHPRNVRTDGDAVLRHLYAAVPTPLASLPVETRKLVLHSMLLLMLSLESYTAYSRVLLLHMASSLNIPSRELAEDEIRVSVGLSNMAKEMCVEDQTQKKAEDGMKNIRRQKAGAGSLTACGGVRLPPPLEAVGIGSVKVGGVGHGPTAAAASLLGPVPENGQAVGSLFGIYGARGAGKMMDSYARDITDFAFMPLYGPPDDVFSEAKDVGADHRRLRVVVCVGGWLTDEGDISSPWRALGSQCEGYALRWDAEMLTKMGRSLETVAKSAAWYIATQEIASHATWCKNYTPLNILRNEAALVNPSGALWPPSLLKISKVVDNPWSICLVRADKAGAVLAEAIMNRFQGERGVSLVGYSLGARVIYMCLMILAEKRALGLVENVAMMGAPVPADTRVWSALRSAVAGRLVNVYSEKDYVLGFLCRSGSVQFGVAGLQCIDGQPGVENVNASRIVTEHLRYQYLQGDILESLGWEGIDGPQVALDWEVLKKVEQKLEFRKEIHDGQAGHAATAGASDLGTGAKGSNSTAKKPQNRKGRKAAK